MIEKIKKYYHIIILIFATIFLEYLMFGRVFLQPNSCLIMDNTDGRQIYFNIAYHVKYGHSYILSNQNYPFFESIFMTDAQASISILLSYINHNLFSIEEYTIGIVNGIIIYSILICSLFLYFIFRYFKIEKHISVVFAILICFLSPQLLRIVCGHYGLSYLFYFPMLIYLTLRLFDSKFKTYFFSLLIILVILFFGFNNGHMSLAGVLYVLTFGFFQVLMFSKEYKLKRFVPILLSIVSFLLFFMVIKRLDFVTDREQLPYGFLFYHAQFESIFLPSTGPFLDFLNWILPVKVQSIKEEGASYVGLIGLVILFFSVYRIVVFCIKKRFKRIIFFSLNMKINLLLYTGILILLYSMAFPFRWGMEGVIDYMPFIRQFRAPGRFAWIFYYTFSIYIAYMFNLVYRNLRLKNKLSLYYILLGACIVLYTFDIVNLKKWNFRYINTNTYFTNIFTKDRIDSKMLEAYKIDTANFSSIYGIPVCNSWNSKFERKTDNYEITSKLIDYSYATSLPWINSKLSRVSTFQTLESGQFVSHPIITRELFKHINLNKKILLIDYKLYSKSLGEQCVISQSEKLFEDELYTYYAFSPKNSFYKFRDSLKMNFNTLQHKNSKSILTLKKDSALHVINKFSTSSNNYITTRVNEDVVIFDQKLSNHAKDSLYEFSIWSIVDNKNDNSPFVRILREDSNRQVIDDKRIWITDVIDYQDGKVRYFYIFKMTNKNENIKVILEKGRDFKFKNMMIKPYNIEYYEKENNELRYNNYRI